MAKGGVVTLAPDADAHVLAHELAHVALGHDSDGGAHHFERSERPQIGNIDEIMSEASGIANRVSTFGMDWGSFVAAAGGNTFGTVGAGIVSAHSGGGDLRKRYLYTVRCGLIDFRHFYQLMYIGLMLSNRDAVEAGRDHELTSEATSRFAAEDTVSNALGALFGSQQSRLERVATFLGNLRVFLNRCGPADWSRMTPADQDTVVEYYGARNADRTPLHQNESSTPAPPVTTTDAAAPTHGIFPFTQAIGWGNQWNMFTGTVDD